MDARVLSALARWPDVPAVAGWLRLDRRGRWLLRGEPIGHRGLLDFIARHYGHDGHGRWFLQNGPQRVLVDLDYTPWVHRLDGAGRLRTHTGLAVGALAGAWLDEDGALLLAGAHGVGVVDDRDLAALAAALVDERGAPASDPGTAAGLRWAGATVPLGRLRVAEVAGRFGFVPHPETDR